MSYVQKRRELGQKVMEVDASCFDDLALEIFRFQALYNPVYQQFLSYLKIDPLSIQKVGEIPFLPISLFKSHTIQTGTWEAETIFTSSGTTGQNTSKHYVKSLDWYRTHARRIFEQQYGPIRQYCILGLLPSYLERSGSSLVYMVQDFISQSGYQESGFFLNDYDQLIKKMEWCADRNIPVVVLGVSFALWELAERYPGHFPKVIFMETGGMKGRRRELTRTELHQILKDAFGVATIHSEYGMTELLSQAYSQGNGLFAPANTLRILAREVTDPLSAPLQEKTGVLHLIDLANLDTISFIATEDLGKVYESGQFEVLGRLDASDLRGCNLLVEK